jgi:hypothetical protein
VQASNLLLENADAKKECGAMVEDKKYPEIAARLGQVRRAFSDLPRTGWADLHGFNRPQYTHWENGTRRIPIENAEVICDRYGLSLDFIYRGKLDGCSDSAIRRLSSR